MIVTTIKLNLEPHQVIHIPEGFQIVDLTYRHHTQYPEICLHVASAGDNDCKHVVRMMYSNQDHYLDLRQSIFCRTIYHNNSYVHIFVFPGEDI